MVLGLVRWSNRELNFLLLDLNRSLVEGLHGADHVTVCHVFSEVQLRICKSEALQGCVEVAIGQVLRIGCLLEVGSTTRKSVSIRCVLSAAEARKLVGSDLPGILLSHFDILQSQVDALHIVRGFCLDHELGCRSPDCSIVL
jgi:hypothetical protein